MKIITAFKRACLRGTCGTCNGSGLVGDVGCTVCHGTGQTS